MATCRSRTGRRNLTQIDPTLRRANGLGEKDISERKGAAQRRAETLRIVTQHHQCWIAGDLEGVLALYHPNIRYFDFFNNIEITADELRDYVAFSLPVHNRVTITHNDRIRVDDDTAFIQYTYVIQRANGAVHTFRSSEAITVQQQKIIRIHEYASLVQPMESQPVDGRAKIGLDHQRLEVLLTDLADYFALQQPFLDRDLDLVQVAQATGYTRNQISYALNHGVGKSFYDYVNVTRIEHLLLNPLLMSGGNMIDAALAAGFNSTSTFYKFFRQHTGLTPKAYVRSLNLPD